MASSDQLLLALAGNAGNVEPDPFYGAGQALLGSRLPQATNSTEAILGPILQGLIGGGMSGYGQARTDQAAFDSYAQNPIIKSLQTALPAQGPGSISDIGPVADGDIYAAGLGAGPYQGAMPSGWTQQQGRNDLLSALITKQAVQDDELAKREARQKLQDALVPKGMTITETGAIVPVSGFAEANASIAEAEARAKATGEGSKPITPPATVVGELADQKGLVDQATQLGNTLKNSAKTWSDLRKAEMFSGLDQDGINASISDLADRVLRSRSGAAAPTQEVDKLRKIVAGDRTVTPQEAGELILKFANREKNDAISKIDLLTAPDGLTGMKTQFQGAGPKATPTPPAGYELTGKVDADGNYGIRKVR